MVDEKNENETRAKLQIRGGKATTRRVIETCRSLKSDEARATFVFFFRTARREHLLDMRAFGA